MEIILLDEPNWTDDEKYKKTWELCQIEHWDSTQLSTSWTLIRRSLKVETFSSLKRVKSKSGKDFILMHIL